MSKDAEGQDLYSFGHQRFYNALNLTLGDDHCDSHVSYIAVEIGTDSSERSEIGP